MSTSVKAMDKVTVKQEPVGLVPEKMNRVASILEFRYGIRAIPLVDSAHDECPPITSTCKKCSKSMQKRKPRTWRGFLQAVQPSVRWVESKLRAGR